jgi:hypothetical protein
MGFAVGLQPFIQAAQSATSSAHFVVAEEGRVVEGDQAREGVDSKELNRKTWKVFKRALEWALGSARVDRICKRYSFELVQAEQLGRPLQTRHVELFSVGAADVRVSDVRSEKSAPLEDLTPDALDTLIKKHTPFPLLGEKVSPKKIGGTPRAIWAWFFYSPLMMDKERQLLLSDVETLSQEAYFERLAKAVVNREFSEGALVPAPREGGKRDYYRVFAKINTGDGLVAYALKPVSKYSTLKPLLIFRPSQIAISHEDALPTYLNDLQLSIGEMGYKAAEADLDALMRSEFCAKDPDLTVLGFSLGGTHLQRYLKKHWRHVSEAICYNAPSIDVASAEAFAKEINAEGPLKRPLKIKIHRTRGDLAHYVGGKHLGWGVVHPHVQVSLWEWPYQFFKSGWVARVSRHSDRLFDAEAPLGIPTLCPPCDLNRQLDNQARGDEVFYYEKLRQVWGAGLLYRIVNCIYRSLMAASSYFNVQFIRTSRPLQGRLACQN